MSDRLVAAGPDRQQDRRAFVALSLRVEESGIGLIAGYAFSAPYEDVRLKPR